MQPRPSAETVSPGARVRVATAASEVMTASSPGTVTGRQVHRSRASGGMGTGPRPSGSVRGGPVQYAESVVDLVGNTPLVRLSKVTRELGPDAPLVLAK